jgi:glucosamine-6-phosphate deaminase
MIIIIARNYKEMSKRAADIVSMEINKKPNLRLGLATGSTPLGMYRELIKFYREKKIDFSTVYSFMLDEYYPISKNDKNSYYYYIHKNLLNHVNIKKTNINTLDGETRNPKKFCIDYDRKIRKSPIDLQILGVGVNGHIGFNEPGSLNESKTRIIELTNNTRKINSRFFKNVNNVPVCALTMGIGTIMKSKKIILLADGKNKAIAIKHLVEGKVDSKWPVSVLRNHKNLVVILDKDAGRLIK